MPSLGDIAPALERAAKRWPEAHNLQTRYNEFCTAYDEGSDLVLEKCKAYLETVAKTILLERGETVDETGGLTYWVKKARESVGLLETRGASPISKILSLHNKMTEALDEVRRHEGATAHGRDGFFRRISKNHLRSFIISADTVAAMLLEAYDGAGPELLHTREPYERTKHFQHLHDKIDYNVMASAWTDVIRPRP